MNNNFLVDSNQKVLADMNQETLADMNQETLAEMEQVALVEMDQEALVEMDAETLVEVDYEYLVDRKKTSLSDVKERVLQGEQLGKTEAVWLAKQPLEELCYAANEIREVFCQDSFDLCTIINAKSGRCSEDCRYCAQSASYQTKIIEYPLLSEKEIVAQAKYNQEQGVLRYSLVTSGRALSKQEVDEVCKIVTAIKKECTIEVCASFGLLEAEDFKKIKEAGVTRIHNNLETSRTYFSTICTSHTYEDKIRAIKAAKSVGLQVCSGGIIGLGESMEDRIDMALELRNLAIYSIPINILNPIVGTPMEHHTKISEDEVLRTIAVVRFLNPQASIRLAGGRGLLKDLGKRCFQSGANAAISGDMLTTAGITIAQDLKMLNELSYVPRLWNQ